MTNSAVAETVHGANLNGFNETHLPRITPYVSIDHLVAVPRLQDYSGITIDAKNRQISFELFRTSGCTYTHHVVNLPEEIATEDIKHLQGALLEIVTFSSHPLQAARVGGAGATKTHLAVVSTSQADVAAAALPAASAAAAIDHMHLHDSSSSDEKSRSALSNSIDIADLNSSATAATDIDQLVHSQQFIRSQIQSLIDLLVKCFPKIKKSHSGLSVYHSLTPWLLPLPIVPFYLEPTAYTNETFELSPSADRAQLVNDLDTLLVTLLNFVRYLEKAKLVDKPETWKQFIECINTAFQSVAFPDFEKEDEVIHVEN